jgi:predicted lipoprotein with Yx(FWY)xxD motif
MKIVRTHLLKPSIWLLIAAVGLAACAPAATPTPLTVPPTDAPTAVPTAAPATAVPATSAPTAVASAASLSLAQNATLGHILADANGRTLYVFTKDAGATSSCYDKCAQSWPALLTLGQPTLGDGVVSSLISTTMRTDGTSQVTYNGRPVYYFAKDKAAGDTLGQSRGKTWWVVSPEGNMIKPASLAVTQTATLGQFLDDSAGFTLYVYTPDTKDTSNCFDTCEKFWPPLLTVDKPALGDGLDASLLGTTLRKDGSTQVTYKGAPLYYFLKDSAPGDTKGQGFQQIWHFLAPDGTVVTK